MNALQIIRDVESHGGKIYLLDGNLKMASKKGIIPPPLLAEVKNHKPEIIHFLSLAMNPEPSKLNAPIKEPRLLGSVVSPAAVAWLQDHRQDLKEAGWPASQLWRRNKSKGIAWSPMWTKSFLKVTLLDSGAIEFEFVDGGKDCINKAYPMPQRPTKKESGK
ncbi:MAG: hypothetical protein J0652_07100 [Desulfobulbaceae bacterium]|nr:hypothetical protein [Desulfobulbaceae bacterium]